MWAHMKNIAMGVEYSNEEGWQGTTNGFVSECI